MPTHIELYQDLLGQIYCSAWRGVRRTAIKRLALLAFGMIVCESCVLPRVAAKLAALKVTDASAPSIERRLRRTLNDKWLTPELCYEPMLRLAIDWQELLRKRKPVLIIVDESGKEEEINLFRVSLAYRGTAVPLAWTNWLRPVKLEDGQYWKYVEQVLEQIARIIPKGLEVIVLADRAYDTPVFVDRIAAHGWHWLVRLKANGTARFLDKRGREHAVAEVLRSHLKSVGMRWKTRGSLFKAAGWRKVSIVAKWAVGQQEPLVVISDIPPRKNLLRLYSRRFWTEPGFRNDKKRGWQWEDSQVKAPERHQVLLLAMAWATLTVLCLGIKEAKARCERLATANEARKAAGKKTLKAQHPCESIFVMGLRKAHYWICGAKETISWLLTDIDAPAWYKQWLQQHSYCYVPKTVPA